MTNNVSYTIAMNIYRALGGQQSGFESVEDVYAAVDEIYSAGGGRIVVEPIKQKVSSGGVYTYNDENVTGYKPVEFEVDIKEGFNFGVIEYDEELSDICNDVIIADIEYSKSKFDKWNPNSNSIFQFFQNDSKIIYAPLINTYNVTNMQNMFSGCTSLTTVPLINTSNVTNMNSMFNECRELTSIPQLDTSSVTDMGSMFGYCKSLTFIPQLDTSNVTNMQSMFNECRELTSIPQLDTSNVTNMSYMFKYCTSLTSIPQLDTSNVTNMSYMFDDCRELTSIPQLDTSNVTNMSYMFAYCYKLTSIPQLDTSNVTNMYYMLNSCSSLTSIPEFDCSSVTNMGVIFGYSNLNNLTNIGGFKNLKISVSSDFLNRVPNATVESLMNVINGLYDLIANGISGKTVKFGSDHLSKLTSEQIAIATNKGWTLT